MRSSGDQRHNNNNTVVTISSAKVEELRKSILYIEKKIDAKTSEVRRLNAEQKVREALSATGEVRLLMQEKEAKQQALGQLQVSLNRRTRVADFAETQQYVRALTEETKIIASHLDIDEIDDTNLEGLVVDREMEKMMEHLGLGEEDRVQAEQDNIQLMQSLLGTAPVQVFQQPQQQHYQQNNNTSSSTQYSHRSPLEHMLL
jgi:hypothetical protein